MFLKSFNSRKLSLFAVVNTVLLFTLHRYFSVDTDFYISESFKYTITNALFLINLILAAALLGALIYHLLRRQWHKALVCFIVAVIVGMFSFVYFMVTTSGGRLKGSDVAENKEDMRTTSRVLLKYMKVNGALPRNLKDVDYYSYRLYPGLRMRITDSYGQEFYYKLNADLKTFELRSLGLDKTYGTSDDILNKN